MSWGPQAAWDAGQRDILSTQHRSWFKARVFVFFSLAWTGHFNFMKKQFEIDWGKIIFSLKTRDPNWPVNRRGVGLIFEGACLRATGAKVSFGPTPSQGEMTKQGGLESFLLGGVLNRCAGSLFITPTPPLGWVGWRAGPHGPSWEQQTELLYLLSRTLPL